MIKQRRRNVGTRVCDLGLSVTAGLIDSTAVRYAWHLRRRRMYAYKPQIHSPGGHLLPHRTSAKSRDITGFENVYFVIDAVSLPKWGLASKLC